MKKLILLLALIFLVSGCTGQTPTATEAVDGLPGPEEIEELIGEEMVDALEEGESEGATVEIDMIARQWEFVPDEITVNEGDTVILRITSEDVRHGFSLPQFSGAGGILEPGEETVLEFVADAKGSYTFSCSVPCGSGHGGMRGRLNVN